MASCINLQLPIVILRKSNVLDMHHHKTYMYINFQQNRAYRSVITVHTILFAKNRINLQLAFRISKNHAFSDMHYTLTDIQDEFEINRHVRYQIAAKRNYFHRRQTEGRTDRQTDGWADERTDGQTSRTRIYM